MIVSQLAHVACTQMLDEALPGFLMSPIKDHYEAFLYPCIDSAWTGYFAARASAILDPSAEIALRELTLAALQHALNAIPAARMQYRFHGDIDELVSVALPAVTALLDHTGHLLGHCDAVNKAFFDDDQLEANFDRSGLRAWVDLFHGDLASIWDRRGRWLSSNEFLLLNRHAERLLWAFGLFPWKTDQGIVRIDVPYGQDAERLRSAKSILKLLWVRLLGKIKPGRAD